MKTFTGPLNQTLTDSDLSQLSGDHLEQLLTHLQKVVAQARGLEAKLLRQVDRLQMPLGDGARSLQDWIVARMDVNPDTAQRLAAVSRAESPDLDDLLADGVASFDRVSELAKAGTSDPRFHLDIVGLRRCLARNRRLTRADERAGFDQRYLAIQPSLDESKWKIWGELPALEGKVISTALDELADKLPAAPHGHSESRAARRADALFVMCDRGNSEPAGVGGEVATSVVVDARQAASTNGESGAWIVSGPRVGPATLERILCDSVIEVTARTSDGTPLAVGTASTAISPRTRRWVSARDGGACTADGCGSSYRLQPHHIRARHHDGDNNPENLTSLCWFHHHVVVHGRGFRIDPTSPMHRRRFLPPALGGCDPP